MNAPRTYIDQSHLPYFYCPGCSHGRIIDALDQALVQLSIDPHNLVVVTDIGCVGLSDKYFLTNTLHGLHGRSLTYATGVKLANPDLNVIVLIGDGGCGIGGHHLINAARRDIGITTLVFNNLNYGMTGGEHSVTTPPGGVTATTRYGQIEQPLDICSTVASNGASFVARTTAFDSQLPDLIANAIQHEGFSLIDIWELCVAYYVPNNRFNKKGLEETMSALKFPRGVIVERSGREYSQAYRQATADQYGKPALPEKPIERRYQHKVKGRLHVVIAGAAGMKIGSAAAAFSRGAVLSGLWATQRNDYPTTVKAGHSVSEVILSPEEILYTGIDKPDVMLVLFPEGLAKTQQALARQTPNDLLYVQSDLLPVETKARIIPLDFQTTGAFRRKKEYWAIMAIARALQETGAYPLEAFKEAIAMRPQFANDNLAAVREATR